MDAKLRNELEQKVDELSQKIDKDRKRIQKILSDHTKKLSKAAEKVDEHKLIKEGQKLEKQRSKAISYLEGYEHAINDILAGNELKSDYLKENHRFSLKKTNLPEHDKARGYNDACVELGRHKGDKTENYWKGK